MGVAGGFVMVVFFSFWGRTYGQTHLGRIQGAAQVMTVIASALGPLILAWCVESTGSYAIAFYSLAATVIGVGVAACSYPSLSTPRHAVGIVVVSSDSVRRAFRAFVAPLYCYRVYAAPLARAA